MKVSRQGLEPWGWDPSIRELEGRDARELYGGPSWAEEPKNTSRPRGRVLSRLLWCQLSKTRHQNGHDLDQVSNGSTATALLDSTPTGSSPRGRFQAGTLSLAVVWAGGCRGVGKDPTTFNHTTDSSSLCRFALIHGDGTADAITALILLETGRSAVGGGGRRVGNC